MRTDHLWTCSIRNPFLLLVTTTKVSTSHAVIKSLEPMLTSNLLFSQLVEMNNLLIETEEEMDEE
jgi:hypothetical protein